MLIQADRAPNGVAHHVLVVGDRDAHADARALADVLAAPGLVRKFGNDLLHVLGITGFYAIGDELGAFGFHDGDFGFYFARIVRANLRAAAIFERGDDASAIGVVFRVGAGDDIHIQRQAHLVAANLH